jgi:hypothetical protein
MKAMNKFKMGERRLGIRYRIKTKDEDSVNILAKQHREDEAIIKAGLKAFY